MAKEDPFEPGSHYNKWSSYITILYTTQTSVPRIIQRSQAIEATHHRIQRSLSSPHKENSHILKKNKKNLRECINSTLWGHDKAVDWWSVGILLFEMVTGKLPFVGNNRAKIQHKILKDKIKLPAYLSSEAHSLLKGLLQKEANKRLGSGPNGSEEIKSHKWFKSSTGRNWMLARSSRVSSQRGGEALCGEFRGALDEHVPSGFPRLQPGFTYVRPAAFLQN
ncbi:Serine/threonine-protein kinase AtPK2/AtPK19 [Acorus calamus]|uniref:Serine/threonine-protein kinase AtPK2/AtPK19 n=1 Tax=Acorus calamus TaxID=4465 RepID=A0AAV9FDE7_ACOCL|nr:Serine/threonine-protein kinase AtPK2/AtPK19 [Acorus calamus]